MLRNVGLKRYGHTWFGPDIRQLLHDGVPLVCDLDSLPQWALGGNTSRNMPGIWLE